MRDEQNKISTTNENDRDDDDEVKIGKFPPSMKGSFIPIRNHALTRILENVFLEKEKLFFIACLSPNPIECEEKLITLKLAQKVSEMKFD